MSVQERLCTASRIMLTKIKLVVCVINRDILVLLMINYLLPFVVNQLAPLVRSENGLSKSFFMVVC